jgi:hypothetical protein
MSLIFLSGHPPLFLHPAVTYSFNYLLFEGIQVSQQVVGGGEGESLEMQDLIDLGLLR